MSLKLQKNIIVILLMIVFMIRVIFSVSMNSYISQHVFKEPAAVSAVVKKDNIKNNFNISAPKLLNENHLEIVITIPSLFIADITYIIQRQYNKYIDFEYLSHKIIASSLRGPPIV